MVVVVEEAVKRTYNLLLEADDPNPPVQLRLVRDIGAVEFQACVGGKWQVLYRLRDNGEGIAFHYDGFVSYRDVQGLPKL